MDQGVLTLESYAPRTATPRCSTADNAGDNVAPHSFCTHLLSPGTLRVHPRPAVPSAGGWSTQTSRCQAPC